MVDCVDEMTSVMSDSGEVGCGESGADVDVVPSSTVVVVEDATATSATSTVVVDVGIASTPDVTLDIKTDVVGDGSDIADVPVVDGGDGGDGEAKTTHSIPVSTAVTPADQMPPPMGALSVGFVDWLTVGRPTPGGKSVFLRLYYPCCRNEDDKSDGDDAHDVDASGNSTTESWLNALPLNAALKFIHHRLVQLPSWTPPLSEAAWRFASVIATYTRIVASPFIFYSARFWLKTPRLMVRRNAAPLTPPASSSTTGWPVFIVSHGVGMNRASSVKLCSDIASMGYIVAAVEHRDGSAPESVYQMPKQLGIDQHVRSIVSHVAVKTDNDYEHVIRREQAHRRKMEISAALDALLRLNECDEWRGVQATVYCNKGDVASAMPADTVNLYADSHRWPSAAAVAEVGDSTRVGSAVESSSGGDGGEKRRCVCPINSGSFRGLVDCSRPVVCGHMFGAASACLAFESDTRLAGCVLIDPWMFAMRDHVTPRPIDKPVLCFTTEMFRHAANLARLRAWRDAIYSSEAVRNAMAHFCTVNGVSSCSSLDVPLILEVNHSYIAHSFGLIGRLAALPALLIYSKTIYQFLTGGGPFSHSPFAEMSPAATTKDARSVGRQVKTAQFNCETIDDEMAKLRIDGDIVDETFVE